MPQQSHACPCNWTDCASFIFEPDDCWDGWFRIRASDNSKNGEKNSELRRVVEHHLKIPRQVRASNSEYWVRRHHWNRTLVLERLVDNPSTGCKKKYPSTPMTRAEALRYGIKDNVDQFKCKKTTGSVLFMAFPNNPPSAVNEFLALQKSQKNTRRLSREQKAVAAIIHESPEDQQPQRELIRHWDATAELPPFVSYCSRFHITYNSNNATTISPRSIHFCIGMNKKTIDDFSSKSLQNKGVCLRYWSYSVLDGKYHSPSCKQIVANFGDQCGSCSKARKLVRSERYPELYRESKATLITPVDILIQAIQQSTYVIDKRLSTTEFTAAIRMLCFVHQYNEPIPLPDSTWCILCPCVRSSSGCQMFSISDRRVSDRLCSNCFNTKRKQMKRETRKEANYSEQVKSSSKTNWIFLSPGRLIFTMTIRLQNLL